MTKAKQTKQKKATPKKQVKKNTPPRKPSYLTKSVLLDNERELLIKRFNELTGAQLPLTCTSPKTLTNMKRRIIQIKYS